MSQENKPPTESSVSRFDLIVLTVIGVLVLVIAGVAYWGSPQRQGATVAYLYPLSTSAMQETTIPNVWIAPVEQPEQARAVTDSELGVFDFGVSDDGRYIAYSERNTDTRLLDIHLLDLQTGNTRQLTNCAAEDTECYAPVFHPDGELVAYMRQSLNRQLENVRPGVPRIWLLNITSGETSPLAQESQLLGHTPVWSADGNTIAFYNSDITNPSISVFNFNPQTSDDRTPTWVTVPATYGVTGTLAPNGRRLIFPDMVDRGGNMQAHLRIVDLDQDPPTFTDFTPRQGSNNDIAAAWNPDGQSVAIARQYSDERWTQGFQIYGVDVETGAVERMIYDEAYSHHFFAWNQSGDKLVLQRLELNSASARPEVWVLDTTTDALTRISERAYHPRWVLP